MDAMCEECGAQVPADAHCRMLLDRLLEVETRVLPGIEDPERAKRNHYLAVATYQAQHPSQVSTEALAALLAGLTEQVGPAPRPVQQLLQDVGRLASGNRRVRRRAPLGDRSHVPHWPTRWTWTARDVGVQSDAHYVGAVEQWARSTVADLVRAGISTSRPGGRTT